MTHHPLFGSEDQKIEYLYTAGGKKVRKNISHWNLMDIALVDYLDGFQYRDGRLQFFPTSEGYVRVSDLGGVYIYSYVYNYTDHLGNIRLSYAMDPQSPNGLKILEENHYYPYGLKHTNYNSDVLVHREDMGALKIKDPDFPKPVAPILPYNYKYNGKEWQDELGLNMYDYGARNYDPAIGRWMNIDLLAEKYYPVSPYTYALNNPMFFVDPNGNEIYIYYGKDNKEREIYTYKKDRDYSKMDSFKADAYRALDALYAASNIEINGEIVNIMEILMNSSKELSIVDGGSQRGSHFSYGRKFEDQKSTSPHTLNNIGTIYFNSSEGNLYDDTYDTPAQDLKKQLLNGNLAKTVKVNSPTSVLGHETIHAFNYLTDKSGYFARRSDITTRTQTPYFFNQEEARTTTLSSQINSNLDEHPRNNYRAIGVQTQGVLSNKITE